MEGREAGEPTRATVEVEFLPPDGAVVTLRGEHDLSTEAQLTEALAQACRQRRVLVDLSECAFIDSIVVARLLAAHRRRTAAAGRFELVIAREARAVDRLARLVHLDNVIPIHQSRSIGIASIQAGSA